MAVFKRGKIWRYEFVFAGKRIQESAKTTSKTVAKEAEKKRRRELERRLAGLPAEARENRMKSVAEMVKPYLEAYVLTHREKSVEFATGRLANVIRLLGTTLLPDLTEAAIHGYIKTRLGEGVSGRTVNMELGELSRAIGQEWSVLWPKVRRLEERKDVGRALSEEEEERLLSALSKPEGPKRFRFLETFIPVSLLTAMRSGEIITLTWGQIDFERRVIRVGKAKTSSGTGREIPMSAELFAVLTRHAQWFTMRFGEALPEHCLFPFGCTDPTRPLTTITWSWDTLRKRAGVKCRLHDLRHTALTKMAEAGTPEHTMLAIAGHMSRAMLERYSHIRMAAKREAVEALSIGRKARVIHHAEVSSSDTGVSPRNPEAVPAKVPSVKLPSSLQ